MLMVNLESATFFLKDLQIILMKMLTIQFQTILPLQEILLEIQQSQVMKKLKNI